MKYLITEQWGTYCATDMFSKSDAKRKWYYPNSDCHPPSLPGCVIVWYVACLAV